MRRSLWDWLDTDHARNIILIALAAPFVAFALGLAFSALRNFLVLGLSPVIAVLGYEAARGPWRPVARLTMWEMALIAAIIAAAALFFLVSPTYLGRML